MKKLGWSINLHDADGDCYWEGVFLFVGDDIILRFDDVSDLESFANEIKSMLFEIKENGG